MELRKKLLAVASLAFAMALSAGVAVAAGAEGETPDWVNDFKISATAVRTQDPSGLRFKVDCPVDYSEDSTVNAYTVLRLTTQAGATYTKKVHAEVWRQDNSGWNTVLTHIPDTDYVTDVYAQAFVVLEGGTTYQTGEEHANIAQTAAIAMATGVATNEEVGHYVNSIVTSVTLDAATASLQEDETLQLTATTAPAGYAVKWTSDNQAVATVDSNGLVKAVGAGTANVIASVGTHTATCVVSVDYKAVYDFETGNLPTFVSNVGDTNNAMQIADYNGSKALKMSIAEKVTQYPVFKISNDYLKWAFETEGENSARTTLSWDLTVELTGGIKPDVTNIAWGSSNMSVVRNITFTEGEKETITITKAQYDALGTSDLTFTWQNTWDATGCAAITWYMDNFVVGEIPEPVVTTLHFNDLELGAADSTKYYLSDATSADSVTVDMYGYNEYNGVNPSAAEKALKFYMSHTTPRPSMYVNIVLTTAMKEAIENNATLSFAYALNRCVRSGYTHYNVSVGATDGNATQQLVTQKGPGYDNTNGTLGPNPSTAGGADAKQWETLTITDATVLSELASTGILQITIERNGTWGEGLHETSFWIDNITVDTEENATTLDFNDLVLGMANKTKYYLSGNATIADNVTVSTFGYNEYNGADASADEKALKFYMSHSTQRQYMYVNIVLTDAMKDAIANGATLSFAYALNRCLNSGYTHYNVSVGATDGSTTQQLVTQKGPGWDNTNGTWGPNPLTYGKADAKQWETLTITDATVLSELATTGILQITIEAVGNKLYHETSFWIDNITVVNE